MCQDINKRPTLRQWHRREVNDFSRDGFSDPGLKFIVFGWLVVGAVIGVNESCYEVGETGADD